MPSCGRLNVFLKQLQINSYINTQPSSSQEGGKRKWQTKHSERERRGSSITSQIRANSTSKANVRPYLYVNLLSHTQNKTLKRYLIVVHRHFVVCFVPL